MCVVSGGGEGIGPDNFLFLVDGFSVFDIQIFPRVFLLFSFFCLLRTNFVTIFLFVLLYIHSISSLFFAAVVAFRTFLRFCFITSPPLFSPLRSSSSIEIHKTQKTQQIQQHPDMASHLLPLCFLRLAGWWSIDDENREERKSFTESIFAG